MMLAPKECCSGCAACYDACAKGAISMVADAEGFIYPRIDETKCVNCGMCRKTCQATNRGDSRRPIAVYAAKAKDVGLRLASSSGGVFSLLARQILAKGGKVYGAAFDKRDWSVEHIGVIDEDGLAELRGSKYVQSRTAGVYRKVKVDLESGKLVLFTGTPCQIAALRAYLDLHPSASTSNLYLVDVVCHGVPSPMVWQRYLDWQCETALAQGRGSALAEGRNIRRISFRRKDCGWKRFSLSLGFANGKEYSRQISSDPFMRAFLKELCNRPSCHDCQCRELRSGSDLTIADFWGIEEYIPGMDDDKGTSLVLANNDKGLRMFNEIQQKLECKASSFEIAMLVNPALVRGFSPNRKRTLFLASVGGAQFDKLLSKMLQPSWLLRVKLVIVKIVRRVWFKK